MERTIWKEASSYDTCQCTKQSTKKSYKFPANLAEEKPRNKLCVDLICSYKICRKENKDDLILKVVTIINSITGWFERTQYRNKR